MDSKTKNNIPHQVSLDPFKIEVCKDPALQGFLNAFHLRGENIEQEKIGEVFGVVQIHDQSEQSNYLPNIIAQVLKKEFFKLPKRNCQESLESALHKVNAALGDLVQNGNTGWIGKLDAVIGAFKDDNFSFSQTGNAKIFFVRNKKISEITKGLDEQNENPIKTFSNVSSGEIEIDDKIIFSTESIHESLSLDDLSRHINTFNSDEFDNLLTSTLQSEGGNVGIFVINVKRKEIIKKENQQKKKKAANLNYFGSDKSNKSQEKKESKGNEQPENEISEVTWRPKEPCEEKVKDQETENIETAKEKLSKELSTELDKITKKEKSPEIKDKNSKKEFEQKKNEVNSKENDNKEDNSKKEILFPIKEESVSSATFKKNEFGNLSPFEEQPELFINDDESEKIEKEIGDKNSLSSRFLAILSGIFSKENISENLDKLKKAKRKTIEKGAAIVKKTPLEKITNVWDGKVQEQEMEKNESKKLENFWDDKNNEKNSNNKLQSIKIAISHLFKSSNYSRKESVSSESKNKKGILILGVFLMIFLLVFVVFKMRNKKAPEEVFNEEEGQKKSDDLVSLSEKETEVFEEILKFQKSTLKLTADNGNIYALTKDGSFYEHDIRNGSTKEILIKDDNSKDFDKMMAMDDLNLIFFLSDNKIISYNRVTEKFENHSIDFPENMELIDIGTKTTYLYLADKKSGQIYRYPRAESTGFAKPKLWLQASADFSKATSMAIDDSIFISYSDGRIEKYFMYKLEKSFLLEAEPKIKSVEITTIDDFPYYYTLDNENGIVAKIKKEDNKVEEIHQAKTFQEARDILLEPESKEVFILTEKSLLKLR